MLPFVYGDKNRLRQVFINIVDNAIKYSNKGDTVSVEAYEEDNEVCISISDTGMGISKDDLPKVKTKFFKGKPHKTWFGNRSCGGRRDHSAAWRYAGDKQ